MPCLEEVDGKSLGDFTSTESSNSHDLPPVSAIDGYQSMGARHRQGTVAHCEAHTLDGPRADISGSQDARYARFQRAWLAIRPRPQARSDDVGAGKHEALGVASNFGRQPLGG